MSKTLQRIHALCQFANELQPYVGKFDQAALLEWLRCELGNPAALDEWISVGTIRSRAIPLSPVLHIVSGNTPHAAFQSTFRGLLLGCKNRVKIPSLGLLVFEQWAAKLPPELACLLEVQRELPRVWLHCEAAVIFGSQSTLDYFRANLSPEIPRIEHGPKLGIAAIFQPCREAARQLAGDILRYEQRGCLSVQAVYVTGDEAHIYQFGDTLAQAMETFRRENAREIPSLSSSGAVANAREVFRFRAANETKLKLWESTNSTAWTLAYDTSPLLKCGPLHGYVTMHQMPKKIGSEALGAEARYLSSVAVFPFEDSTIAQLDYLQPPRICQTGAAQDPTIYWHHDGGAPLSSLVKWRDVG